MISTPGLRGWTSWGYATRDIKEPAYTANAMLTFSDPDNVQLEFFWRAAKPQAPSR